MFKTPRTRAIEALAREMAYGNRAKEAENEIYEKEAKTNAERLEFEKATKDRADVSIKEYEKLKSDLEYYQNKASSQQETLMKVFRPLRDCQIDEEYLSKFFDGEFKCKVEVLRSPIQDPLSRKMKVAVIYEIDTSNNH